MASRSRTHIFLEFRGTYRTHKRGPRTNTELREFKVHKNLLAAQSDDEGSTVDARVYSVPPIWVTMVDDMNRDISQIKIKSAHLPPPPPPPALLPGERKFLLCTRVCLPCGADWVCLVVPPCGVPGRAPHVLAVSEMQTQTGKALLPGFADDDDQEELIAQTVTEVSGLFKDCERRLKEMGRTKAEGSGDEVRTVHTEPIRPISPPSSPRAALHA
jgi:hypothetical protein